MTSPFDARYLELQTLIEEQAKDDRFGHVVLPEKNRVPLELVQAVVSEEGERLLFKPRAFFQSGRKIQRRRKPQEVPHGDISMYSRGCRCDLCKAARAAYALRNARSKGVRPKTPPQCGTVSGYMKKRCRCEICRSAHAAYMRSYRLRQKEAA